VGNASTFEESSVPFGRTGEKDFTKVLRALAGRKNNSSPGPHRVPYRLLKLIKDTPLGEALIARTPSGDTAVPSHHRDGVMVMIPKPSKDHTKVKGWGPIVLAYTIG